jgi:hypothetical protein
MKNLKNTFKILLVLIAFTAISCSSDDDSGNGAGTAGNGQVVATIDGTSFQSISQGTQAVRVTNSGITSITITAINLNGQALNIFLTSNNIEATSYDFTDASGSLVSASYTIVDTQTFESTSYASPYENSGDVGTITITELTDTGIKGTFQFDMSNQDMPTDIKSVTNGSFDLTFTVI